MYRKVSSAASVLKSVLGAFLPMAALLLAASSASAQFETASLVGRVSDTSGAVVVGAPGDGNQSGHERCHYPHHE